jgi:hypothetical protein
MQQELQLFVFRARFVARGVPAVGEGSLFAAVRAPRPPLTRRWPNAREIAEKGRGDRIEPRKLEHKCTQISSNARGSKRSDSHLKRIY